MSILVSFIAILFITNSNVFATTPLTPQLSCWFNSYDNLTRNTHLVMGYENTALTNTLIYVQQSSTTDPLKNIITPLEYNGRQQDLFRTGVHPFDFEIIDRLQILQSGSTISWSLGTVVLTVRSSDLTQDNLCQAKYPNNCPLWIRNFCNDASYCNGHETCTPKFVRQLSQERFGVCQAALRVVSCEPGTLCDESLLGCVQPPTDSPSQAPTEQPTAAMTTEETEQPTAAPTLNSLTVECNTNLDCASKQTFCLGSTTCVENSCKFDSSYDACSSNGHNGTIVIGKGVLMNMCIEESRSCIAYYVCSTNADCDDGLLCTGTETCGDGICHPGSPLQCIDSSILCTEAVGCGPLGIMTDEDISIVVVPTSAPTKAPTPPTVPTVAPTTNSSVPPPPTTNTALVIFALVFGAISLLIIIVIIFFIIRSQNNRITAIANASANGGMQNRIKS